MQRISAQRHKVNRVVNYATEHLAEPIDLNRLADVACMSKFHFSRVFSDYYRETPFEFLTRTRLELAARSLKYLNRKPITEIALDCGYSSAQNFSRAFRHRFQVSPRNYRTHQQPDNEYVSYLPQWVVPPQLPDSLDIKIEHRPDYRVAYIRHLGAYGDADGSMTQAFIKLESWARKLDVWDDAPAIIGLCPDNPAVTPRYRCRYDVCIPVESGMVEDDLVSIQVIPGGHYATLRGRCLDGEILGWWKYLTTRWLPENNATHGMHHSYEYYPLNPEPDSAPGYDVEVCLRLEID